MVNLRILDLLLMDIKHAEVEVVLVSSRRIVVYDP